MVLHNMAAKGGASRLLSKYRPTILRELDVSVVLPQLVDRGVFSFHEEREILYSRDQQQRTEVFIELLGQKGLNAFHEFCSVLEHNYPRLLTSFLLDSQGICIYFIDTFVLWNL